MDQAALGRYYLDEDTNILGNLKEQILQLLGSWEKPSFIGKVTLYNSASTGRRQARSYRTQRLGARNGIFETASLCGNY